MRKIAANSATILLFAITLFFLGPQLGALDTDGDGVPDVPVMVTNGSNAQKVQDSQGGGQTKVGLASGLPFLGPICCGVVVTKGRIVLEPRGSRPDSLVTLRC